MTEITAAELDEIEVDVDEWRVGVGLLRKHTMAFIKVLRICRQERDRLKAINDELLTALERIAEGKGAYNRDPLEHASNVIDEAKAIACVALGKAQGDRQET